MVVRHVSLLALICGMLAGSTAHAQDAVKPKPDWKPLFNGKSLDGWKVANFGGEGEVHIDKGAIVMERGSDMTGVTYAGKDFPKLDYEVSLEGKKLKGFDFFCTTTFPVGDTFCSLVVGGWGGTVVGLSSINGADASENETRTLKEFKHDQWYRVRIRVVKDKIMAWIDDKQIIDADIKDKKITIRAECELCKPFGVATWSTSGAVRDIKVRKLTADELKADPDKKGSTTKSSRNGFPVAGNAEAWSKLPREEPPLPEWARLLIVSLPKTTGAMLELDHVHRVKNPLGPMLAAKLRYSAADAVECVYGKRYAESDLRRAGLTESQIKTIGYPADKSDEAFILAFARKLTLAGHAITDAEMEDLIKRVGAEKTVAIVHSVAYANFQNRVFVALGVQVEPGGPLAALDYKSDPALRTKLETPPRKPHPQEASPLLKIADPDWKERRYSELMNRLELQMDRKGRIPFPEHKDEKTPPSKIVWSRISLGYQPLLTKTWFDCMSTFQQEANFNRVFSNSVFWVVTRSNECFY
jgi:alkylhydroperoxidase family enzyme